MKPLPLVIVHEQLTEFGGTERVLEAIARAFPTAPVFGLAFNHSIHPRLLTLPNPLEPDYVPQARNHFDFLEWCARVDKWNIPPARAVLTFVQAGWSLATRLDRAGRQLAFVSGVARPFFNDTAQYLAPLTSETAHRARIRLPSIRKTYLTLIKRPHSLWAPSRWSADLLYKLTGRSATVVSPFHWDRRTPDHAVARAAAREGFVAVGRLVRHKQFETLLAASEQIPLRLSVIGGGRDAVRLANLAGSNANFLGELSDQERDATVARSLALICPSVEEFGLVMAEALSLGTPVIAPRAGAALEIVEDRISGTLVSDPLTPEKLASAMVWTASAVFDANACIEAAARLSEDTLLKALQSVMLEVDI